MNANIVYLFGLIGLRALVEYDPYEYKRCTDLSKRDLENRINSLLEKVDCQECSKLYEEMNTYIKDSETHIELTFLLRQIYVTSFQKAQYSSMLLNKIQPIEKERDKISSDQLSQFWSNQQSQAIEGDELIKLSVMLILKHLRNYKSLFHQNFKNVQVDCVLEPTQSGLPYIVLIAKSRLSDNELKNEIKQLKNVMSLFGEKCIGIIVTESVHVEYYPEFLGKNMYLLLFDIRKKQFLGPNFDKLVSVVKRSNI